MVALIKHADAQECFSAGPDCKHVGVYMGGYRRFLCPPYTAPFPPVASSPLADRCGPCDQLLANGL